MHKDLQLCMGRFRAGLDFTHKLLTPLSRKAVNECGYSVHIIS
jgi:hypothetical protein